MKRSVPFFFLASLWLGAGLALAQSNPTGPSQDQPKDQAKDQPKTLKPTGACTITVYGITPTCTAAMTRDACSAGAQKVHGTADWKEAKSC